MKPLKKPKRYKGGIALKAKAGSNRVFNAYFTPFNVNGEKHNSCKHVRTSSTSCPARD